MIIERIIEPYSIYSGASILEAIKKIGLNKKGFVFVLSEHGILEGIMTDGDFRRWLIDNPDINLESPVLKATPENFVSVIEGECICYSKRTEGV